MALAGDNPADAASHKLERIEHIVILMLENRSFDHMLGYLSLEAGRTDLDGLQAGMSNTHGGTTFPIHHLKRTAFQPFEDPDHSAGAVDTQINKGKMDGFAASFAATLTKQNKNGDPGLVLGYYNAADLPVYDHLAEHFCVCDRWFSSVPGATMPNRLYAITGQADGSRDDRPPHLPPLYDKPSFVRHLDAAGISWRWYSYDPGTLRSTDAHYMLGHYRHFAYVEKTKLPWQTRIEEWPVIDPNDASFLEDAARGTLPAVAWVDPNFNDLNLYGSASNDDHPPSDITEGQHLVLAIYNALAAGPKWEQTLLVVTYDEHGGFFDHVAPPQAVDDNPTKFGRYGVRVPALIVSPFVGTQSVSHEQFDHTSIIKTILLRFTPHALQRPGRSRIFDFLRPGAPKWLGSRVAAANSLGSVLTEKLPRPAPDRSELLQKAAEHRAERARAAIAQPPTVLEPIPMSDLQIRIAAGAQKLRKQGLPPGQP